MARTISDLVRTMASYFRIGTIRIKDSGTVAEIKNSDDSSYVPVSLSKLKVYGSSSGCVVFSASPVTTSVEYRLPGADGTSGQVLSTDASGNLSWTTVAVASNQVLSHSENVLFNSSTPIVIFTPPANSFIQKVIVDVDTAFDATGVNLSVGVVGTTSRYMGTTDIDLATVAVYEVEPMYQEDGTPEQVIITFNAGSGGAAGSCYVTVIYSNPG